MAGRSGWAPAHTAALALAVAFLGLCLVLPAACLAGSGRAAPADAAFLRFLDQGGASGRLGLVPAPVSLGGLGVVQPVPVTVRFPQRYTSEQAGLVQDGAALQADAAGTAGEIPTAWDLRSAGKLSPVRDQGAYGTCWAFAALASLESSLRPGSVNDYSENNLAQRSGFALGFGGGGNSAMAAAYLLRWDGPVDEADDPYASSSITPKASPTLATTRAHVHEVLWLPPRGGSDDNAVIKWAVMTYGAVYTTMNWTDAAYRSSTASYCSTEVAANHAVDVVGWDDSYPASRFRSAPAGPGAFLVRNSWGPQFGLGGYFWVSYHDAGFGSQNAVFTGAEPADPAERVYQHDPLGWVASYRPPGAADPTSAWFAAAYTPAEDGTLTAAGFYAATPGSTYEVRVAGSVDAVRDAPVAAAGILAVAGYHTVALDAPLSVAAGRPLVIAVRLTTPGCRFPVAVERPFPGYADATAAPGQSFVSGDGSTWTDMTTLIAGTDVCLKGYGRAAEQADPAPEPAPAAPAVSLSGGAARPKSLVRVAYRVDHATAAAARVRFTLRKRGGAVVRRQTLDGVPVAGAQTWKFRAPTRRGIYVVTLVATLDAGGVSAPVSATLRVR